MQETVILSAIYLSRLLTGLVCVAAGVFWIVRHKLVESWLYRLRVRLGSWAALDEFATDQEAGWQFGAIVQGIGLLIFAVVQFATAWS